MKWTAVRNHPMPNFQGTQTDLERGVFLSLTDDDGDYASGAMGVEQAVELGEQLIALATQIENDFDARRLREEAEAEAARKLPEEFGTVLVYKEFPDYKYVRVGTNKWIGSHDGSSFTDVQITPALKHWSEKYDVQA